MTKVLTKDYKVKVTPKQSVKLQSALFKHGFKWFNGVTRAICTDEPYLFLEDEQITYCDNKKFFDSQEDIEEITYKELMNLLNAGEPMKFSKAIKLMKKGKYIKRPNWSNAVTIGLDDLGGHCYYWNFSNTPTYDDVFTAEELMADDWIEYIPEQENAN